jgi:hypothetical protein
VSVAESRPNAQKLAKAMGAASVYHLDELEHRINTDHTLHERGLMPNLVIRACRRRKGDFFVHSITVHRISKRILSQTNGYQGSQEEQNLNS